MCVAVCFVVTIVYMAKLHIHQLLHQDDFTDSEAVELLWLVEHLIIISSEKYYLI